VHSESESHADVTEGSGGVWERLHYDWSDPARVVGEDHRLQRVGRRLWPHLPALTALDGTTHIDYGEGKNLKGRFLGVMLGTVGKRVLA